MISAKVVGILYWDTYIFLINFVNEIALLT